MRKSIFLLLLLAALPAGADVYRWVGSDGAVHYSDTPPAPDAKPTELPKLQTFKSESLAGGQIVSDSPQGPAPSGYRPVITSPQADDTIREASGDVTVTIAAPPPGTQLVYYLDGTAQKPAPTSAASFQLSNVERGTHAVAVAVVDDDGKERSRSDTVTFYMKPPTINMGGKKN